LEDFRTTGDAKLIFFVKRANGREKKVRGFWVWGLAFGVCDGKPKNDLEIGSG